MDVNLENLIEKIKKEGIEDARLEAEAIIEKSRQDAAEIVEKGRKEAEQIVKDAQKQATQFKDNARADIHQAARDTELLLKERIQVLFDGVFKKNVAAVMTPDFLKELLLKIIENWSKNSAVTIVLNEKDKKQLEELLFASLKKDLKDSVTLKISKDISRGFRIASKGEEVYYDFTDDTIAEILKTQMSQTLQAILDK